MNLGRHQIERVRGRLINWTNHTYYLKLVLESSYSDITKLLIVVSLVLAPSARKNKCSILRILLVCALLVDFLCRKHRKKAVQQFLLARYYIESGMALMSCTHSA